jgi:hypothetical protein
MSKRTLKIYPIPDAPLHRIKKYPGYFIDDNDVVWSTHGRLFSIRPLKRSYYKRIPKYTLSLNCKRVNVSAQELKPYKKSKRNIVSWPNDEHSMIADYQLDKPLDWTEVARLKRHYLR